MQHAVVLHCLEGFLQLGRNAKRESINHHPTILFDDSRGFSSMVGSYPDELPRAKRESALALGREIKRERERVEESKKALTFSWDLMKLLWN